MSKAVITSYTLLDFLSEGDMLAFFTFVEEHMEGHAANLRAHGMTKFYVSRVFNKGDKYTIGNWLELARKLHPLFREVVASAPYLHESNLNLVVADSPPLIHNPFCSNS